jgi:hypothetical protein
MNEKSETTPPKKKKITLDERLSDPKVARLQDTWLRDYRRARNGEPLWDEDAPKRKEQ